jgi:hypothetical protein
MRFIYLAYPNNLEQRAKYFIFLCFCLSASCPKTCLYTKHVSLSSWYHICVDRLFADYFTLVLEMSYIIHLYSVNLGFHIASKTKVTS